MRRVALLLIVGLTACPKKPPPKPPPLPPDLREELREAIKVIYTALEKQEPERLDKVLTPDVFAYGLGPKDTYTDSVALIDTARTELIPFGLRGDVFKLVSSSPKVQLASGDQSGWFYDFPKFERVRDRRPSQLWKVRMTGHAVREGQQWRFDAVHVSFGYPDTELYAPEAAQKLKVPSPAGAEKGLDTDQMIGLTKRMLDDIAVKVDRTSDAAETVLIGTDASDVYEGGAKFKALARPKLPELKKAVFTQKIEDGPRAKLAKDRKSGWVSGIVVLKLGKAPKQQVLPPFRALWIYSEDKDAWTMVSEHQSVALPNELRAPTGDEPEPTAAPVATDAGP